MKIPCTHVTLAAVALLLSSAAAAAQTPRAQPPRDRAATALDTDLSALANGWGALAAGRWQDAVAAADSVLSRRPGDHRAVDLKIEALAPNDPMTGLDSYEAWLGKARIEDVFLLVPVARSVLTRIGAGEDRALALRALQRLALTGDGQDAANLQAFLKAGATAAATASSPQQDLQLALQGDTSAAQRLANEKAVSAVPPQPLAKVLASAGPAAVPILRSMLKNPAAPVRMEAALSLGKLGAAEAIPDLKAMMADPQVRTYAAVALTRLGDAEGEPVVKEMLASPVLDMRVLGAQAYEGKGQGPWVQALMPALKDPNGLTRIQAAEMLAPVAPEAALPVLLEAAKDPNPVVRADVMRVFERTGLLVPSGQTPVNAPENDKSATLESLRRMLRDADASTRIYAAGAIVSMAKGAR